MPSSAAAMSARLPRRKRRPAGFGSSAGLACVSSVFMVGGWGLVLDAEVRAKVVERAGVRAGDERRVAVADEVVGIDAEREVRAAGLECEAAIPRAAMERRVDARRFAGAGAWAVRVSDAVDLLELFGLHGG